MIALSWVYYAAGRIALGFDDEHIDTLTLDSAHVELLARSLSRDCWSAVQVAIEEPGTWVSVSTPGAADCWNPAPREEPVP